MPTSQQREGKRRGGEKTLSTWLVLLPFLLAAAGLVLLFVHGERIRRGAQRAFGDRPSPAEYARAPAGPAARSEPPEAEEKRGLPRVAIVIDDLGYDIPAVERLLALHAPLTFAVLPGRPHSEEAAALVRREGRELILHQPMEALVQLTEAWPGGPKVLPKRPDAGPGEVLLSMSASQIESRVRANVEHFPGIVGMNNHMGSAFTQNKDKMSAALAPLLGPGLYFLDSRTIPDSVGYEVAQSLGLRAVQRDIFLDHQVDVPTIEGRFEELLEVARKHGSALAIGHPHPETVEVLEREVPALEARGFRVVPAGALARAARAHAPPLSEQAAAR